MADLSAFLPWSFNGLAAGLPRGGPRCRIRHGTVLFTDVAGFTPLTEALSVLGREGSEELTRILNAYFTRMISIADQEGGDVLRFGGDSMTLLFPGKAPGRALRAAARMMEAMGAFAKIPTRAGTFSLSMKVGAAAGPVLLGIVGGDAAGYDFYAAGPVLDGATAAEHQALPGEVVLHPSVGGPPPRGLRARTRGGKRLLLGSPATGARRPDHDPPPPGPVLEQVVPRVLHGFADETVLGEHRGTAVLFVRFDGVCVQAIEEGGGAPVRRLHDALEALHKTFSEAARQHGGYLNKLDMGDKGAKALLLFGSPRALENKEEMAVRTALHLLQRARLPEGITLRMGLASAPLFAGPLGAPHRREYTAMGNGINLAARLMQNAGPGQIRCDEATARAVPSIEFRPLATVRLKGLQAPVPIFEPGSEREDGLPDRSERLVEREEVQRRLLACLVRGQGGPLLLRGGPGLGKTALIEWALGALQAKGRPCVRVPLGPHSASKPFAAWRGPLRALLGVSREDGPETVAAALQARVRAESARHAPLLFPLLDLPAEEPAALGTFGPEERKDLTFALLRDLLLEAPGWSVLFDNIQWADPLSLELLALLLDPAGPAPIRVAATLRPGYPKVEARLKGMEPLDLPPLSEKGLLRLLTEGQGFLAPEREVSAWFAQRSRGNPAVALALVTALDAAGCIQRGSWGARLDGDRLFRTHFPDTLEGLYLAPVDRLSPAEKRLLQQAAVLGVSVSVNLLREVSGLAEPAASPLLDSLEKARLLLPDTWGVRPYVRFADAMLRDAVYAATPFEVKRDIHARMARFLERDGASVPKLWPALAHHFRAAGEDRPARRYARLAGRDAYSRADQITALEHLERVCRPPTSDPEDVEDAFRLMDVYESLGKWADAAPVLAELQRLEPALTLPHRARLRNYLAIQTPGDAEALLLEGVRLAQECGEVLLEAKARLNLVGRVYGPTGRMREAKRQLAVILASPDVGGMALWRGVALMNLGNASWVEGNPQKGEQYLRRAARIFRRAGLAHRETEAANNLSALLGEMGAFAKGAWWAHRALRLAESLSQRSHLTLARLNLVSSLLALGEVRQASFHVETAEAQAQAQGHKIDLAHALQRRAYLALLECDGFRLASSSRKAIELFRELAQHRDAASSMWAYARYCRHLRRPDQWLVFLQSLPADLLVEIGSSDEAWARPLAELQSWVSEKPSAPPDPCGEPRPTFRDESLEAALLEAERGLERMECERHLPRFKATLARLQRWPTFETRLASLLLQEAATGKADGAGVGRLQNRLRRCAGGIHGIRVLGLLVQRGVLKPALTWEGLALDRLSQFRGRNPSWAWDALLRFPEIKALANRLHPGPSPDACGLKRRRSPRGEGRL